MANRSSCQESAVHAPPLVEALDKNKQATERVQQAADDLVVVHAVLDSKLPPEIREGDVDQAVAQTQEIKKQLSESAELLEEANSTLEQELKARKKSSTARDS